jgi:hypothetical protein
MITAASSLVEPKPHPAIANKPKTKFRAIAVILVFMHLSSTLAGLADEPRESIVFRAIRF